VTARRQAKILDFGLAKVKPVPNHVGTIEQATQSTADEELTSPGSTLRTVAYMSPEQVKGKELDARTDLFSFGAVLYEMCTGVLPFRGDTSAVIFNAILERPPVSPVRMNPDLPTKLEEVINKALEKDRNLRYQHASEMKADLQRLKRDTESRHATASSTAGPRWSQRTTVIGAVAFVSIIALIAVAAFYLGRSGHAPINSVAVLPFSNANGDPNTEYLSDGITEGVIDRLSGLPNLKVISRTSAFRYKQRDVEPQRVAKELGVEALVTGRVVQRGDDLTVERRTGGRSRGQTALGRAVQGAESGRRCIRSARDCNRDLRESAGAVDHRRQDSFGEVIGDKSRGVSALFEGQISRKPSNGRRAKEGHRLLPSNDRLRPRLRSCLRRAGGHILPNWRRVRNFASDSGSSKG